MTSTATRPATPWKRMLTFDAVDGIDEAKPGDDIAQLIVSAATLARADVVVVTSKIVSKG